MLLLLILPAASPAWSASPGESRPNVLFIAVDDLRPEIDGFGVDDMITPHLDRLAVRGVQFNRAYCNIAVCGASRASLMTGLRPTPTRFTSFRTWTEKDAPGIPTLPGVFREHGYQTVSNGKVYHHQNDDARAWTRPPWRPDNPSIWWAREANRALATGDNRGPAYEWADLPDELYPDHQVVDRTLADLRRLAEQDQPFFLACGFYRPHLPFVVPKKYWDLYPEDQTTLPDNMFFPHDLPQAFNYNWGELRRYHGIPQQGPVSTNTAIQLIRGYRASVSFIDAQIGRLLDELERQELCDNTIIVLWGDHGWQLGEHSFWCKHTNFEVAVRAPLLIAAPGIEGGRVTQRLVEFIDIFPTLCELTGLPLPEHLQGQSLLPLLHDGQAEHKQAVFTRHGGGDAVRTERYRYMEMRTRGGRGERRGVGLFDLEHDPDENQNVAEESAYAEVRQRLQAMLDAFRDEYYAE